MNSIKYIKKKVKMTSAMTSLRNEFNLSFKSFFEQLSDLTQMSNDQLFQLWNTKPVSKKVSGNTCDYTFQKGKNPGKVCGESVCTDSTTKCRKHLKFEGATPSTGVKQSFIAAAKEMVTENSSKTSNPPKSQPVAKLTLTKNSHGNFEHKATNFVFNTDRLVYGKQVGDKVVSLTNADVDSCMKHGFKYLPEAVAEPESTNPQENEEEVTDEELVDEDVSEVSEVDEVDDE